MQLYKQSGGKRNGSGRNRVPDKKKQVFAMVRQSMIDLLCPEEVKRLMMEAVVYNGQIDDGNMGVMKISLNSDMKVVRFSFNDGPIEIAELIRVSDKLCFKHENKMYYITDFGRVQ